MAMDVSSDLPRPGFYSLGRAARGHRETYGVFNPLLLWVAEKDLGGCFELAVK